jgi:hypothetical protein
VICVTDDCVVPERCLHRSKKVLEFRRVDGGLACKPRDGLRCLSRYHGEVLMP